ncbi:MAG: DUF1653 domain-containing protein [Janthinobacterium lividum]
MTPPLSREAGHPRPQQGQVYQHYKGARYMALVIAKEEATGREVVVYQGLNDSQVWTRPLDEFQPPRFKPVP